MTRTLLIVLVELLAGTPALADPPSDELVAEMLGAAQATRLRVDFDGAPARDVLKSIGTAIGVPVRGRYHDDRIGHGIDPHTPVYLKLDDAPAMFVLEAVLDQVEIFEPCTWQMRNGFIEVGTKERLSAPAGCSTRTYDIRDLRAETGARDPAPHLHLDPNPSPYTSAALSHAASLSTGREARGQRYEQEPPEAIVIAITQMVEPGNWDDGLSVEDDQLQDEEIARGAAVSEPKRTRRGPRKDKIAKIRLFREDSVIITAPDFIHRAVGGYPEPVAPALDDDTRRVRSERASAHDRIDIAVLRIASEETAP